MDHFASWVAADGRRLLGDIIIPVAAILIPTLIAVNIARIERRTARQECEDAARDRQRERRLDAAAGVIAALAPLASFSDVDQPMQQHFWELRASRATGWRRNTGRA